MAIRDGFVVDGSGRPGRRADIGIQDGKVVLLGECRESARRTVDASDLVVAPGFVDLHTHYDAQVMWDPTLDPSSLHGVTTVIGGNCGFTIAPAPADPDYISRMLACVEGMPIEALQEGLDWEWDSFGDWLDRLEGRVGLNVGFLVGHSTIRRAVIGDRAVGCEATVTELEAMVQLLDESLSAGGLGFSTTRSSVHVDHEGEPVPSRWASRDELLTLAGVVSRHPGTWLEMQPSTDRVFPAEVVEMMADMSAAANRILNWNLFTVDSREEDVVRDSKLAAWDVARSRGGHVVGLTLPVSSVSRKTLGSMLYQSFPGWGDVLTLPMAHRVSVLRDPQVRQELERSAATTKFASTFANWADTVVGDVSRRELTPLVGRSLREIAVERSTTPFDVFLDVALDDDFKTGFHPPNASNDDASWEMRARYLQDPRLVLGGSDAGAHLDQLTTYNCFTTLIGPVVRERQVMTLERAVQLVTDAPARLLGLRGRGRIEVGGHADLVVFDPETVDAEPVVQRHDLPGGALRLHSAARGIVEVIVGGHTVVRDGDFQGTRAGHVLRSGRDTSTVTAR